MALSVFDDSNTPPTAVSIKKAIGKAGPAWSNLIERLHQDCDSLQEEWAFAGARFGWSLRLKRGERVIVHLTPCEGHFLASFALGEKACAAAKEQGLPAQVLKSIADAPKYAEGRGVRIPVRTKRDLAGVETLAAIKMGR
jgi:hypothetical protein